MPTLPIFYRRRAMAEDLSTSFQDEQVAFDQ
jgi:hypothetical protein